MAEGNRSQFQDISCLGYHLQPATYQKELGWGTQHLWLNYRVLGWILECSSHFSPVSLKKCQEGTRVSSEKSSTIVGNLAWKLSYQGDLPLMHNGSFMENDPISKGNHSWRLWCTYMLTHFSESLRTISISPSKPVWREGLPLHLLLGAGPVWYKHRTTAFIF